MRRNFSTETERRKEKTPESEIFGAAQRIRQGGELRSTDNIFFKRRVEEVINGSDPSIVKELVKAQHANTIRVLEGFDFPPLPDMKVAVTKFPVGEAKQKEVLEYRCNYPNVDKAVQMVDQFNAAQIKEICKMKNPLFAIIPNYSFDQYLAGLAKKRHEYLGVLSDQQGMGRISNPAQDEDLWAKIKKSLGWGSPIPARLPDFYKLPDEDFITNEYVSKRLAFAEEAFSTARDGFGMTFGFIEGEHELPPGKSDETVVQMLEKERDSLTEFKPTLTHSISLLGPTSAAFLHMNSQINNLDRVKTDGAFDKFFLYNRNSASIIEDGINDKWRFIAYGTYDEKFRMLWYFADDNLRRGRHIIPASCFNLRKEVMQRMLLTMF